MATRICDGCGTKQPFGRKRTRQPDGRMLCDNCVAGRPGIPLTGAREAAMTDPLRCEACGQHSEQGLVRTGGLLRCADGCRTTKVAHDPGDPAVVAHCPGCGSGSVTRRSDGSVECGFCGNVYTIWAQPQFAAMPQTVNGAPMSAPGLPDRDPQPPAGPDGFAPAGTDVNTGFAPAGGGPVAADPNAQPKRVAPVPAVPQAAPQPNPLAATGAKVAMYLTDDGVAIGEASYLARLALEVADDKQAVLAQVRASRKMSVISASSVSAALRRGGLTPVARDYQREGITVSGNSMGMVFVNAFIEMPNAAKRMSATAEQILKDAGYTVERSSDTQFSVTKS